MSAGISKKSLIGGIFLFLLLLLAGNASCEVEPVYAGWTVGNSWDGGSGTGYGTILRSTDSGKTWIRQGEGQIADVNLEGVFAMDPYTAWAVGVSDNGYATIYHTTDGGNIWARKGSSNPDSNDYVPDTTLLKVHARGNDVWAVGAGTILHTSDSGATWTNHIPTGYENTFLQGVYMVDSNTVWVTGGPFDNNRDNHYVLLKTTDSGLHWTRQDYIFDGDYPGAFLGISAADADTAWAVGNNYTLLKTIDGGATWRRDPNSLFGGIFDLNEVYAVSPSTVWVAGDNGIYWTTDDGQNWDSSAGLLPGSTAYKGISAVSDKKAWAAYRQADHSGGPGFGLIASTADGGINWTTVEQLNGEDLPQIETISFATQPITNYLVNSLINSLIKDMEQLVDEGFLDQGQGNALIKKLEKVLDRLADDRNKSAVNVLNAFLNQVDAFVRGGVLPPETGQELYDQVNDIIELISFTL